MDKSQSADRVIWLQTVYGDNMRQILARGDVAEMRRLAESARDALNILRTAEGRKRAAYAEIPQEHINDIRLTLRRLRRAIKRLEG
jgi:hypothetical protein